MAEMSLQAGHGRIGAEQVTQRRSFFSVALACAGCMGADQVDVFRPEVSVLQGGGHAAADGAPVRLADMFAAAHGGVAGHFGEDAGAAADSVFQRLQHDDAGAFAADQPGSGDVKRP